MGGEDDLSPRPSRRAGAEVALTVLLGVVLSVVAWFRLDATTRGTVWAEDGLVFLSERDQMGPWDSILHVYAGYLHVVPRLLTDLAGWIAPIELYAVAVTALCCATVGTICALIFACTRGVIDSVAIRLAIGATTVLVPAGSIETMGNLANLHWYFLWLTPWLLVARPTRWSLAAALGVVALLAGLTEIQVALFLPLTLFRRRDPMVWPVAAGLTVGVTAQIWASLTHPRVRPEGDIPGVVDQVKGYLLNVVLPIWKPSVDGPGSLLSGHGWIGVLILAVPFLLAGIGLAVAVLMMVRRRSFDRRALVTVAVALGATGPFVGAMVLNPSARLAYDSFTVAELAERMPLRYGVVPAMFVMAGVLLCIDLWNRRDHARPATVAGLLVALVIGLQLWHLAPDGTRRSDGPGWRAEVTAAQDACPSPAPPPVAAAPTADWAISLPCDVLLNQ